MASLLLVLVSIMKKHLLALILLTPLTATASDLHLSPEVKIGPYLGAGIQVGMTDVLDLDAVFFSYNRTAYQSSVYDEAIDSFRIGGQKMLGASKTHGFQAEVGYAKYDGTKDLFSPTRYKADGISIGGAYVFQATESLALRGGVDFNLFGWGNTHIPYDISPTFNLGVILNL